MSELNHPTDDVLLLDASVAPPYIIDRREPLPRHDADKLRAGLTRAQLATLTSLESFRWRLAFVRRPLFQAPIPVLFDREETRYVVIEEDGTLNEQPTLQLRA